MKRRTFILTTAVAGTAVAFAIWFNWHSGSKWKKLPLLVPFILSGFCDEQTIRNIGISYLKNFPPENSKNKLHSLVTSGISGKLLESSDYAEIARQLAGKVEQDFKAENIMTLKGWVISKTEARQCADSGA